MLETYGVVGVNCNCLNTGVSSLNVPAFSRIEATWPGLPNEQDNGTNVTNATEECL